MKDVAVLFARKDSIYKFIEGCEVYDAGRDATTFNGNEPVIAHPPCRLWGIMAHLSSADVAEKDLARFSVRKVRENGGVLEHPASSRLWQDQGLGMLGKPDAWGGWTFSIDQSWFGHVAPKNTRLYIVGCSPINIPALPLKLGEPYQRITTRKGMQGRRCTQAEREGTPVALAHWLVELTRRCGKPLTTLSASQIP